MEIKKSKSAQAAAQDFLSIEMIGVELDSDSAKRTKESAQKILGMMFASLHKKDRPSKHHSEEIKYGI